MTLMDYFPDDFLIIVDESHMTIPQIRGMYAGTSRESRHWWTTVSVCPLQRITDL